MARLARNRSTAPAPRLLAVMESFLLSLRAADRSPKTLVSYRVALEQFAAACDNPPLAAVTVDDCRRHILSLRDAGRAPATVSLHHRLLARFFRWCEGEGLIDRSPMIRVERPHVPERVPQGFSEDELRRLISVLDTRTPRGARDRALFLTLYGTGLRISECLSLRKGDLDGGMIRVIGKGDRERLIALGPSVRQSIAHYLLLRGEDDEPALWLGERGPLTDDGAYAVCRRRGTDAGVEDCHPHKFRHTALAALMASGLNDLDVARISGHRQLSQLRHYTNWDGERRANEALLAADHVGKLLAQERPPRRKR